MRKTHSQFVKIQPFIQTLRTSDHPQKDHPVDALPNHSLISKNQPLSFKPRERSTSKSNTLRGIRKVCVGNVKPTEKYSPECLYSKNCLQINFNNLCSKSFQSQQLRTDSQTQEQHNSLDAKQIKLSIIFSKTKTQKIQQISPFAEKDLKDQAKIKLDITPFLLSIEDQSKVRRTFDINLDIEQKRYLQISFIQNLQPEILILNNKMVFPKEQIELPLRQPKQVCEFRPWDLINQRKILLENKILAERPKSKIKWSFSLTESTQFDDRSDLKVKKFSEIQQNYGLTASQQSAMRFEVEKKSKSYLNLNSSKQKGQTKCTNLFLSNGKQRNQTISMKSTFESDSRSDRKQQVRYSNELKRENKIIGNLNLKEEKVIASRQIGQEGAKPIRPKSSFKSLKEKNDYFQMKESDRKKSIRKSGDLLLMDGRNKIVLKSSQIKQEYGIM